MKYTLLTPAALLLAFSHLAVAQSAPEDTPRGPVKEFDPLTVSVSTIDRGQMSTSSSIYQVNNPVTQLDSNADISQILNGIPGLQVNDRQNYAQDLQLSIHGFGARSTFGVRGIKILVDGIPASMPDGQGQTSNIDLNSLDNVQVLTGPFSTLYGNASGGTILANTRSGEGPLGVSAGYSDGGYSTQHGNLVIQKGSTPGSIMPAYYISTSYLDNGGYRDNSTAYKNLNNAKFTWDLSDGSQIKWVINDVHINADDPGGLTREDWELNPRKQHPGLEQYHTRKYIDQTQNGVNITKVLNQNNELDVMGYFGRRHVTQYLSIPEKAQQRASHAGGVVDFVRHYHGADLHWKSEELLPYLGMTLGVTYDRMKDARRGYENFENIGGFTKYGLKGRLRRDEDNITWNLDPYMLASWSFAPDWYLDGGVRFANNHFESRDDYVTPGNADDSGSFGYHRWLPSVALGWQATDDLYTYISYSKGFETPTITELAYSPIEGDSGFNTDLRASTSDNYEFGLKSSNNYGDFTAALYYITTHDDIVPGLVVDGRGTFRNAPKTTRRGIDLGWNKKVWKDLKVQASYSFIDAKFSRDIPGVGDIKSLSSGKRIPGIARNEFYTEVGWRPDDGLQAEVDFTLKDRIYVNDQNDDSAAGYGVLGAGLAYVKVIDDWTVNAYTKVDNLLNKKYIGSVIVNDSNGRFFESAPKRNATVGLRVMKVF